MSQDYLDADGKFQPAALGINFSEEQVVHRDGPFKSLLPAALNSSLERVNNWGTKRSLERHIPEVTGIPVKSPSGQPSI